MFGDGNNPGLLVRSVAFVLNTKSLFVSVVELIGRDFFDLTSGKKEKIAIGNQKKIKLESANGFDIFVSKITKLRIQKKTNQNETSSRSHLFFNFEDENGASLAFFDLAGWESAIGKDINETKFINSSLTSLNTVFEKISQQQPPSFDSSLSKVFKPYLTGSGKCCMLYHVSNNGIKKGLDNIKNVVASKKGANRKLPLKNITNIRS